MATTVDRPFSSPTSEISNSAQHKIVAASSLGTVFEWYDFYLYGSLAAVIGAHFFSELAAALKADGYPSQSHVDGVDWIVAGMLTILVIYVTIVYGPIAAMPVELFPARIRDTAMPLPYHIGNGWFGGFLPVTAFAIVAATGNIYAGLMYPIIVSAMTLVPGVLFIRETRARNIVN